MDALKIVTGNYHNEIKSNAQGRQLRWEAKRDSMQEKGVVLSEETAAIEKACKVTEQEEP